MWIERRWRRKGRVRIGEYEPHHGSRHNREFPDGFEILADERDGSAEQHHIRTGDSTKRAVIESRHPRHYRSIAKTQNKLGGHGNASALTDYEPNDVGMFSMQRHEIDQQHSTGAGLRARLQYQSVAAIATRDSGLVARRNAPMPVLVRTQKGGEASIRVETWPT